MQTLEIGGVEFNFQRTENPRWPGRKFWQVSVKKTGKVMECFTGKTLAEKIENIKTVARLCGDRFKTDSEAA